MSAQTDQTEASRITRAARHIHKAQLHLGPEMRGASPGVQGAWDEINEASIQLYAAGARVEETPLPNPLETLTRIERSREQGLALLAVLAAALPVAEDLDKARGDWAGDMADTLHGETPGTNFAESVQHLHLTLKHELFGLPGGGRE